MGAFLTGEVFGNNFPSWYMIVLTYPIPRSWSICNKPWKVAQQRVQLKGSLMQVKLWGSHSVPQSKVWSSHLIHQAHVKTIFDTQPLKEGTGREIRKLHYTVLQYLSALKSMGYKPSGPFITSTLELKLDQATWVAKACSSNWVHHYWW